MFYLELISAIDNAELVNGIAVMHSISKEIFTRVATAERTNRKLIIKDLYDIGTHPTIQLHVEKLTEQGWIERQNSEEDKRVVYLSVTPRARQALVTISEGLRQMYKKVGELRS